jgi:hypothetical protein
MADVKPWLGRTIATAVCVVAVVIGAFILGHGGEAGAGAPPAGTSPSTSNGAPLWSDALDPKVIDELKDHGYTVEPLDPPAGDPAEIVANAVASFRAITQDEIQSVSYANVSKLGHEGETQPCWVVYLTHTPEIVAGGPNPVDASSESSGPEDPVYAEMAIFMDPKTQEMRWAVQY